MENDKSLLTQAIERKMKHYGISKTLVKSMIKYKSWDKINDISKRYIIFEAPDLKLPMSYFTYSWNAGEISSHQIVKYVANHQDDLSVAEINDFANLIITANNSSSMYLFAKVIKKAPIEMLANAIINLEDACHMYLLLEGFELRNELREKLVYSIIDTGNAEYIYKSINLYRNDKKVARDLVDALISTGDALYLKRFELDHPKSGYKHRTHSALINSINNLVHNKDLDAINDYLFELEDQYDVTIFERAKEKILHPRKNKDISID